MNRFLLIAILLLHPTPGRSFQRAATPKPSALSALRLKKNANQRSSDVELDIRDESNLARSGTTSSAKNPSAACTLRLLFGPACWPARI